MAADLLVTPSFVKMLDTCCAREEEATRDLRVGGPGSDLLEHLPIPRGEVGEGHAPVRGEEATQPSDHVPAIGAVPRRCSGDGLADLRETSLDGAAGYIRVSALSGWHPVAAG